MRVPDVDQYQSGMMYQSKPYIQDFLYMVLANNKFCDSDGVPVGWKAKELQMKRIITHFLGDVSFETSDLQQIADTLDNGRNWSDTDSLESHDATLTNDYSIDPLSTSTMRKYATFFLFFLLFLSFLTQFSRLLGGAIPLELFQDARTETTKSWEQHGTR